MKPPLTFALKLKEAQAVDVVLFQELSGTIANYTYAVREGSYEYTGIVGRVGASHVEIQKPMLTGNRDMRLSHKDRVIVNKRNIAEVSASPLSLEEFVKRYEAAEQA